MPIVNPAKYEVLIKQYFCSILAVSVNFETGILFVILVGPFWIFFMRFDLITESNVSPCHLTLLKLLRYQLLILDRSFVSRYKNQRFWEYHNCFRSYNAFSFRVLSKLFPRNFRSYIYCFMVFKTSIRDVREFKHDVNGGRQTAKITSDF